MGLLANTQAKTWIRLNRTQLFIYRDWWSLYEAMGDYWLGSGGAPWWADRVNVSVMDDFLYKLNS